MLRNPIYAVYVAFRGGVHQGLHPAIIARETFEACTAVLDERGEDYSRRASNSSEYTLAGLIRCTKCRRRLVGIDATGRLYRYRYYTCPGRQQYGRHHRRDTNRLTAARAEQQTLQNARAVFSNKRLLRASTARAAKTLEATRPNR